MPRVPLPSNGGRGIRLACTAYACFTIQDALVKWLVADYPVFQVLFVRSCTVFALASLVGGRGSVAKLRDSRNKPALAARAGLILAAWLLFYSATRRAGLAELTTVYFAAPVMVVVLSVAVLGERVSRSRWLAVGGGFAGVVVAGKPGGGVALVPALMALAAAACWATSGIMARMISRTEGTLSQMLTSNALFATGCGVALVRSWVAPSLGSLALMCIVGLVGAAGQYMLFESYRHAPASLLAPTEYTSFVWSFLLGYLVWGDVPTVQVWLGAVMIALSGWSLFWSERRVAG